MTEMEQPAVEVSRALELVGTIRAYRVGEKDDELVGARRPIDCATDCSRNLLDGKP